MISANTFLADLSRRFFQKHKVFTYRMKKIADLPDKDVIHACHCFCEEHGLISEWNAFRAEAEASYHFCPYLQCDIDNGLCYELQMIAGHFILPSALPDIQVDCEACMACCNECEYGL